MRSLGKQRKAGRATVASGVFPICFISGRDCWNKAYKSLLEIYQRLKPIANVSDLKKKLENWKFAYGKEVKKVMNCIVFRKENKVNRGPNEMVFLTFGDNVQEEFLRVNEVVYKKEIPEQPEAAMLPEGKEDLKEEFQWKDDACGEKATSCIGAMQVLNETTAAGHVVLIKEEMTFEDNVASEYFENAGTGEGTGDEVNQTGDEVNQTVGKEERVIFEEDTATEGERAASHIHVDNPRLTPLPICPEDGPQHGETLRSTPDGDVSSPLQLSCRRNVVRTIMTWTPGATSFSCSQCASLSTYKNAYASMRLGCNNKRSLVCSLCRAKLTRKREKPFLCSFCAATFIYRSYLEKHLRTHTGEKPYLCSECPAKFASKSRLREHMRLHSGEKPFSCWYCGLAFRRRGGLAIHMKRHSGVKEFPCLVCPAKFVRNYDLKSHMRIHTGEKPFCCALCEATFSHKCSLATHIISHTGVKPFNCSFCEAGFVTKRYLDAHVRKHTGEKPFSCLLCAESFKSRIRLGSHVKSHHTNKDCFTCAVCSATFTSKNHMKTHIRMHS